MTAAPCLSPLPSALDDGGLAALVDEARNHDEPAWRELVTRFDPMVRRVARSYKLSPADVDDVVQATWMQAFKSLGHLRQPAAISGWLATIARREASGFARASAREYPTDDMRLFEAPVHETPDVTVLEDYRRDVLGRAIATLPPRHRALMSLIAEREKPDYRAISVQLGIPVGSIGPIRGRCLTRLQRIPEIRGLRD